MSAASAALIWEPVPGGALGEGHVGDFSSAAGTEEARTSVEAVAVGPIMTRPHTRATTVAKEFVFIEHSDGGYLRSPSAIHRTPDYAVIVTHLTYSHPFGDH
ncbi:hypothetical protein PV721_32645 [Streptomyces sp. MB09-01]|uniref:hypothetical protein n=1 Tax=Streptomyces sp. MB09-01 TaxID=3028666 RepID=UPI0029BECD5A|nr:hypothetical protein [Streptomyces sp. MB09-01]MDX3538999.1 hypothetical protein [Streptomyces sp. MB09-01]